MSMDYIYLDNKQIGERIKSLRKEKGYTSRKALSDATKEIMGEGVGFSDATIEAWETGKSLISLEFAVNLCNFFECDIQYLLGFQKERTRVNADICKETGLSEKAVRELKKEIRIRDESMKTFPIAVLNSFMEKEEFRELLFDVSEEKHWNDKRNLWFYHLPLETQELCRDIFRTASNICFNIVDALEEYKEQIEYRICCKCNDDIKLQIEYLESLEANIFANQKGEIGHEEVQEAKERFIGYTSVALSREYTKKSRLFTISDTFLDLVKDYIKDKTREFKD